jgi:hypothetical protein
MAKKATKKKRHNLPEELTVWREGEQGPEDCLLCVDDKPEDCEFGTGVVVGIYKLVKVGTVQMTTMFEPIEGA